MRGAGTVSTPKLAWLQMWTGLIAATPKSLLVSATPWAVATRRTMDLEMFRGASMQRLHLRRIALPETKTDVIAVSQAFPTSVACRRVAVSASP
mmetsp:Transcript_79105/g.156678  ORF Transcript_79105/g.156678 Transcript_79105/m.156678 type:complete len:94 (-) Transcript_79105:486-767(-)